jgi:ADP-heptose:LPS heptosyltransferase
LIPESTVDSPRLAAAHTREPACGDVAGVGSRTPRVLIVKRDKLGDLLLTTPVLAHLAASLPQAQIHLLANDYNAWVVSAHPNLHRTWTYPRTRDGGRLRIRAALSQLPLLWQLRRQRFDWALVMGGDESHRGIRLAIASGAARTVAYAEVPARYGARLTDPRPLPAGGHETARMLALLEPLGLPGAPLALDAPTFTLPPDARAFAAGWLAARGLRERGYVVIGVGARRTKKQPTADQIARWASCIHEGHGLPTVFMWTPGTATQGAYPGDDALAETLVRRGLPHVHPFRGPIREALGLIYQARTSIIPDSGLMHFAAASPGGVLGLFADPADSAPASRWAPLGARARHLEARRAVADLPDEVVLRALAPLMTP